MHDDLRAFLTRLNVFGGDHLSVLCAGGLVLMDFGVYLGSV